MTAMMRQLAVLALLYLLILAGGFLLYLALIASPLLASIPLLFYRGVLIGFIGAALLGGC
ncbi:hypothetical protein ACFOKF_14745 [Sphingobium rhizovicinum]|uniref:Uncharacterized protein n=1 Tax=Sphingobium rhizovicinum TaxID=432308 RepID=A0ABV7NJ66_9SPHN